jgi:hypothetical protein
VKRFEIQLRINGIVVKTIVFAENRTMARVLSSGLYGDMLIKEPVEMPEDKNAGSDARNQ